MYAKAFIGQTVVVVVAVAYSPGRGARDELNTCDKKFPVEYILFAVIGNAATIHIPLHLQRVN